MNAQDAELIRQINASLEQSVPEPAEPAEPAGFTPTARARYVETINKLSTQIRTRDEQYQRRAEEVELLRAQNAQLKAQRDQQRQTRPAEASTTAMRVGYEAAMATVAEQTEYIKYLEGAAVKALPHEMQVEIDRLKQERHHERRQLHYQFCDVRDVLQQLGEFLDELDPSL